MSIHFVFVGTVTVPADLGISMRYGKVELKGSVTCEIM